MPADSYVVTLPTVHDFYRIDENRNPGYWIAAALLRHALIVPAWTDDVLADALKMMRTANCGAFSLASADRYLRADWTPEEKLAAAKAGKPQFIRDRFERKGWTIRCVGGKVQVVRL